MLDVFIVEHRDALIERCRAKVGLRSIPPPTPAELEFGVPQFLDELVTALQTTSSSPSDIGPTAARHGRELQLQGFTVSQVVHDYGDVCQSVTDLALELGAPISVEDFRTLNRCLDDAIASAVTEYGSRDREALSAELIRGEERLAFLAHEIRNFVQTASIAFEALRTGHVGVDGSTGRVLHRSLSAIRDLINRSLTDVRLRHSVPILNEFAVDDFITEVASAAALEALAQHLTFHVVREESDARIHADRPSLTAVLTNLLQNAFKFTRPGSRVTLHASCTPDRFLIAVEDECGGLADGKLDELFRPFEQRNVDRTGLGLGLAMCQWGAEVNGGQISVRNLPGHGCVFTVSLPRA